MLLQYLRYTGLAIKSCLSPLGYTGCLKKSKFKGIANLLSRVFLIAFSLVVTVIAVLSAFFAPAQLYKLRADCITWSSLSSSVFTQVSVHRYLIDCINFFCSKRKHLFFHQCSTYIVSNAMCFVGWLSIKIIYNFTIIYKYATSMMDYKILSK